MDLLTILRLEWLRNRTQFLVSSALCDSGLFVNCANAAAFAQLCESQLSPNPESCQGSFPLSNSNYRVQIGLATGEDNAPTHPKPSRTRKPEITKCRVQ
eukprot:432848-Amphidinium_carterae.1